MTAKAIITITIDGKGSVPQVKFNNWHLLVPRDFSRISKYMLRQWKTERGAALHKKKVEEAKEARRAEEEAAEIKAKLDARNAEIREAEEEARRKKEEELDSRLEFNKDEDEEDEIEDEDK